jgi:anti-anti-sigma factor
MNKGGFRLEEADGAPLRVRVRRDVASSVVEVAGEIDLSTAPAVKEALDDLLADGERHVIVDLAGLQFMDTTGLHLLEDLGDRLASDQGQLELRRPTRGVARLLDLRAQISAGSPPPWTCQEPPETPDC